MKPIVACQHQHSSALMGCDSLAILLESKPPAIVGKLEIVSADVSEVNLCQALGRCTGDFEPMRALRATALKFMHDPANRSLILPFSASSASNSIH